MGVMRSSYFQAVYLMLLSILCIDSKIQAQKGVFNVLNYGASAGGKFDNTRAISNAWSEACRSGGENVVLIPSGVFLVGPVVLKGPCKGLMEFSLLGNLTAPTDPSLFLDIDHWISFQYIGHFVLRGGGTLDGQGPAGWPYNTCHKNSDCKKLPVALRFDFVTNARINHINLVNSKNFHMNIFACDSMVLDNLKISSPEDSPNTDGIHIAGSTNINIQDSIIGVGDDCISMGPGTSGIHISSVQCGPGHGISIGSLGRTPNEQHVDGIVIRNSTVIGTQNGLRIKTWSPSNPGLVSNITFEHIKLIDVENPIVIDQLYCPARNCGQKSYSEVAIRDVKYINIRGSSRTKAAVNLRCSEKVPCQNIELTDINIDYQGPGGGPATSSCSNVIGVAHGKQNPPHCL